MSEFNILEKVIDTLKEAVLLAEDEQETDKESDEITSRVDALTQAANEHLDRRINTLGEEESEAPVSSPHLVKSSKKDDLSVISSQKGHLC